MHTFIDRYKVFIISSKGGCNIQTLSTILPLKILLFNYELMDDFTDEKWHQQT